MMKNKIKKELNIKTEVELKNLLKEARNLLFSLKVEQSQGKLKNKKSVFTKRKEIAFLLTILRQKELMKGKSNES